MNKNPMLLSFYSGTNINEIFKALFLEKKNYDALFERKVKMANFHDTILWLFEHKIAPRHCRALFYGPSYPDKEHTEDDLCLVTIEEQVFPNDHTNFYIEGYTYRQINENKENNNDYYGTGIWYMQNKKQFYRVEGRIYQKKKIKYSYERDRYFVNIENCNCYSKDRTRYGCELFNYLLTHYKLFNIKDVLFKYNIEKLTNNELLSIMEFYLSLDFRRKNYTDNKIKTLVKPIDNETGLVSGKYFSISEVLKS